LVNINPVFFSDDDMQSMVSVFNSDRSYDIGNLADIDDDEEGQNISVETSTSISELAAQIEAFNHDCSIDGMNHFLYHIISLSCLFTM